MRDDGIIHLYFLIGSYVECLSCCAKCQLETDVQQALRAIEAENTYESILSIIIFYIYNSYAWHPILDKRISILFLLLLLLILRS